MRVVVVVIVSRRVFDRAQGTDHSELQNLVSAVES